MISLLSCAEMIRRAFTFFANTYVFLVALNAIMLILAVVSVVWMATTNSVSPELLHQVGPVLRTSQDPSITTTIRGTAE